MGGVYAFYDCDGEPTYVGQTKERLRNRIRRHLTNQSTDAVAMSVLDPFEVAEIEMWPFGGGQARSAPTKRNAPCTAKPWYAAGLHPDLAGHRGDRCRVLGGTSSTIGLNHLGATIGVPR